MLFSTAVYNLSLIRSRRYSIETRAKFVKWAIQQALMTKQNNVRVPEAKAEIRSNISSASRHNFPTSSSPQ